MKKYHILLLFLVLFVFFIFCDAKSGSKISYVFDIQPIFSQNCYMCHSDEEFSNANLNLTSYERLMAGDSNNGPVVVPFYPENSLLVDKIFSDIPAFGSKMPIGLEPLTYDDITLIEHWIYSGAKND